MKKKVIILLIIFAISIASYATFSAFSITVEKTGTITTKELSSKFLNDADLLAKVQALDSSIESVDKMNDLTRVNDIPSVELGTDNLVSTNDSSVPIYLWIDSGTIYYFTIANTIDFNV